MNSCIINLLEHPQAAYAFREDASILEMVYPTVQGSDACVIRMGQEVMLLDCSTDDQAPVHVIPVLKAMGIDHIHVAFNSHPHEDHITGFETLEGFALDKLLIAHEENYNSAMIHALEVLRGRGVKVEHVQDGDVLRLGQAEMTVIQRAREGFQINDLSAMLKIRCGERTLLSTGDVEDSAQQAMLDQAPACGLTADIMKFPHHGLGGVLDGFYAAISPDLVVMTAREWPNPGLAYLQARGAKVLNTWDAPIRLRTDGHIWVVDTLPINH